MLFSAVGARKNLHNQRTWNEQNPLGVPMGKLRAVAYCIMPKWCEDLKCKGLIVLVLWLAGCTYPVPDRLHSCSSQVFDTQGHRGARAYRPENTLPAMQYAIERGVNTLEMDVSVTKDNVLVLSHNPHLLPEICLTPEGLPTSEIPIRSLTLKQLKKFDCGSLRNPRFPKQLTVPGTPPPTLREVLHLGESLSKRKIHYNIETKIAQDWDPALTPTPEQFATLINKEITSAGVGKRTIIQSFDPRTLTALKKMGSNVRTALLVGAGNNDVDKNKLIGEAQSIGADILSPEWHLVTPSLVKAAHAVGVAVIPWTINHREAMHKVIAANVDGMISDDVDLMMEVAKEEFHLGQAPCWQE